MKRKNKFIKKKTARLSELVEGILIHDKIVLSQTITLLESTKEEHNILARQVIEKILPYTGNSIRIGITGVPGVGKSTFIESLGKYILLANKKIAVLAIDPTSQKSKGSILGDKTRMESISTNENVFIRPSPAGNELGGVHRKTRETILLCEAAGFDNIIIETVGVGQSEIAVHSMVDCFLLLMLPGAGDELQGIKRGIMEMADIVAINKAANDKDAIANKAVQNYKNALHLLPAKDSEWITRVLSCSALNDFNIQKVLETINEFERHNKLKGSWKMLRNTQNKYWMQETIEQHLHDSFYNNKYVKQYYEKIEKKVLHGEISSFNAAEQIIKLFNKNE